MYLAPSHCPVCQEELRVARMVCPQCGTAIEGQFALSRLAALTPEQADFVELFLRCEGKLNRVQEELGLSYPTVRSRLEEVIRALGYEVREEREEAAERRLEVLQQLARREITAEEALRRL